MNALEQLEFDSSRPKAQPLYVDANGRILRFALEPGQTIEEHEVPASPLYIFISKGQGVFTDGEGNERSFGANDLLVFDPGEKHSVRALDERLVFLAFLHGVADARPDRAGGLMGDA